MNVPKATFLRRGRENFHAAERGLGTQVKPRHLPELRMWGWEFGGWEEVWLEFTGKSTKEKRVAQRERAPEMNWEGSPSVLAELVHPREERTSGQREHHTKGAEGTTPGAHIGLGVRCVPTSHSESPRNVTLGAVLRGILPR